MILYWTEEFSKSGAVTVNLCLRIVLGCRLARLHHIEGSNVERP